jgi:formamidopyrimidine-DNA glycosylase
VHQVWKGVFSKVSSRDSLLELEGYQFASVTRHGKFLILGLKSPNEQANAECFLVVHLRMTGRLFLVPHEQAFDRYTRLALLLDNNVALRFDDPRKFGRVWLVDDPAAVISGLGPDALSVGSEEFASRLAAYRRQLKPLLLDQSFLAGIGNIYADESLFRARLHPLTISSHLEPAEVKRLFISIKAVLDEAVAANGANIDGVFKAGKFLISVYGRDGCQCFVCGTKIIKIRVGQRGTHLCPLCQKLS